MPQLNPSPWFLISAFAWTVLILVILPKLESHSFPNEPSLQELTTHQTESWNWPWH
uniref:ATP synthase F0 subunit 8 n=1 Tax=Bregmaceros mcclellandi TaxID=2831535 RepID=UPI001EDE0E84|nr:ATP synthase F0 subunit 8 [Bregmaceros mcclellandi]UIX24718.1 ATP synthase F0 subunit 8 [Bregmaceros mcclellandi]